MAFTIYPTLGGVAGTDEADAQSELKHAMLQGNLETQKTASEKLVTFFPQCFCTRIFHCHCKTPLISLRSQMQSQARKLAGQEALKDVSARHAAEMKSIRTSAN
jgi:hypothetical protein